MKWSFKCDLWNSASLSHKARTHGPGWRTAHASSIDEKGLIDSYSITLRQLPPRLVRVLLVCSSQFPQTALVLRSLICKGFVLQISRCPSPGKLWRTLTGHWKVFFPLPNLSSEERPRQHHQAANTILFQYIKNQLANWNPCSEWHLNAALFFFSLVLVQSEQNLFVLHSTFSTCWLAMACFSSRF